MSAVVSAERPRYQCFPFRNSLMDYILKNLNINAKEKLSQTCKLLFFYYPFDCIIKTVVIGWKDAEVHEDVISCFTHQFHELQESIWVTDCLYIFSWWSPVSLTPVITRCTAKILDIQRKISVKDFELLTEAETVEELSLYSVGNEESVLPVEDIIARVPNAYSIEYGGFNLVFFKLIYLLRCVIGIVTPHTGERLLLLNRKQNIQYFCLGNLNPKIDVSMFYQFLNVSLALKFS